MPCHDFIKRKWINQLLDVNAISKVILDESSIMSHNLCLLNRPYGPELLHIGHLTIIQNLSGYKKWPKMPVIGGHGNTKMKKYKRCNVRQNEYLQYVRSPPISDLKNLNLLKFILNQDEFFRKLYLAGWKSQ